MSRMTLTLASREATDVERTGGKGAALAELTRAGFDVPRGFVVDARVFDAMLVNARPGAGALLELAYVDPDDESALSAVSRAWRARLRAMPLPPGLEDDLAARLARLRTPLVAVRSSGLAEDSRRAAWAGQLDTFLGTPRERVAARVRDCWASLFTPRALAYRAAQGLEEAPWSIGVVVQEMVPADVAGVAFSVHPVTRQRGVMLIEACHGLGETLVSGRLTPDRYTVARRPARLLERHVVPQERALRLRPRGGCATARVPAALVGAPKLSDEQVLELADLVRRVERHHGRPCDVEWTLWQGRFQVLQSRPITTLGRARAR